MTEMTKKRKIAVLMGGQSAERSVSLATGKQILESLDPEKYEVYAIDTASGQKFLPENTSARFLQAAGESEPVTALTQLPRLSHLERPDCVFIALHGPGGEDGTVQGFLEMIGVPYTGSGILASALAMDKVRYKQFMAAEAIPMAAQRVYHKGDNLQQAVIEIEETLNFPVVIKAASQGSSYGTSIATEAKSCLEGLQNAFEYDHTALVEQKLEGIEITVAVLGNENPVALPVVEISTKDGFFDFTAKYSQAPGEGATEIVPARISDDNTREAQELAVVCHRLLGCRGMSRTDMFITDKGIYVLETNTIPGMTPTSLLPKAAKAAGIEFGQLLDHLIDLALEK
jgi:D-alanine-D-alanine ligase